jgi:hypothetical protein
MRDLPDAGNRDLRQLLWRRHRLVTFYQPRRQSERAPPLWDRLAMTSPDRYLHFDNIDMTKPVISARCCRCQRKFASMGWTKALRVSRKNYMDQRFVKE